MRLNVGYRRSRRSYGSFSVQLDSYAANVARGARYERRWELNTIGKRIDRNFAPDAQTLPQTANADSDLQRNEITVPAAMFAPPHFDAAGDDAANLGSMGATIGHEMMHGFDDEGAQFDAAGRLQNWWSPRDLARKRRAERCVMNQYHRIDVGGEHYDGRLIAGEAIADLGGVRSGYRALQLALAQQRGKRPTVTRPNSATLSPSPNRGVAILILISVHPLNPRFPTNIRCLAIGSMRP